MKKFIVILLIVIPCLYSHAQSTDSLLPGKFQGRIPGEHGLYAISSQGLPLLQAMNNSHRYKDLSGASEILKLDSAVFSPDFIITYEYDESGFIRFEKTFVSGVLDLSVEYQFEGGRLVRAVNESNSTSYQYESGKLKQALTLANNDTTQKLVYEYNASNKVSGIFGYDYSSSQYDGSIVNVTKEVYFYNGAGLVNKADLYFKNRSNSNWIHYASYYYSYTSNNLLFSAVDSGYSSFDNSTGALEDFHILKEEYEYDTGENIINTSFFTKNTSNNAWNSTGTLEKTYTYLADSYDLLLVPYWFNNAISQLLPDELSTVNYSYLCFKDAIETRTMSGSSVEFKYSTFNGTINAIKTYSDEVKIYPNPAQAKLWITLPDKGMSNRVVIYDATGRLVKEVPLVNEMIDLDDMNQGIYFLKAYTNSQLVAIKNIVIRK